jgi:hypothetical protein
MFGVGTADAQVTVSAAGQVTVGAVTSFTVMICAQVAVLPQASVALYVRVIVYLLLQIKSLTTSPSWVIVGVPAQLSVAVMPDVFAAGINASQATVVLAGQLEIVGTTSSLIVIVCVHTAVLLQASVAW